MKRKKGCGPAAAAYVPLDKRSKRAQRAWYADRRGSWNGLCPVSRIRPSGKRYDRNRLRGCPAEED